MKAFSIIVKILIALNAVIGGIYILATYGEQIIAWCKKVVDSAPETFSAFTKCRNCCDAAPVEEAAPAGEAAVEEVAVEEEVPVAEEATIEEVPAAVEGPAEEATPVIVVSDNEPVAEESDFAE